MPIFADHTKRADQQATTGPASNGPSARSVQLKKSAAGVGYEEGAASLSVMKKPTNDVTGPIGRVFNRILGQSDNAKGTAGMAFNKAQVKTYLDKNLKFADGEWFRGKKLDGVADKLMETLDADKNGLVGWAEFQTFKAQVLQQVAPGVDGNSTPDQVNTAAGAKFDKFDKKRKDGSLNFDELQAGTKSELPKDTDHADLIAQLGARIALDAVDTDQRSSKVKDRTLSRTEWTSAAQQLAR